MFDNVKTKAIIYSYFTYTKVTKEGEKGLICINYLIPNKEDKFGGWKNYSSWVNMDDALLIYLKDTLIKQSTIELRFREDYRNSSAFIQEIVKINDFDIKQ